MTKYLTLREVQELDEKIGSGSAACVERFVRACERQIRDAVSKRRADFVFFDVPSFVVDVTSYEPDKVATAVLEHFRRQEFYAKLVSPRRLFISWKFSTAPSRAPEPGVPGVSRSGSDPGERNSRPRRPRGPESRPNIGLHGSELW